MMAMAAQRDQEKRTVEVNRLQLLATLTTNRTRHLADYQEAMDGYKKVLMGRIDLAFENAKQDLQKKYEKIKERVMAFTDEDISKQRDSFTLVDAITIEMKVPRSYVEEYDSAIDIAKWDVNETLELTYAEFTCFVRNQWDWSSSFEAVSMLYKSIM